MTVCTACGRENPADARFCNACGVALHAEGDLDFRGTLAVDKETPVGFSAVRLRFELESDASEEELAALLRLTERYCVVYQTLAQSPSLTVSAS